MGKGTFVCWVQRACVFERGKATSSAKARLGVIWSFDPTTRLLLKLTFELSELVNALKVRPTWLEGKLGTVHELVAGAQAADGHTDSAKMFSSTRLLCRTTFLRSLRSAQHLHLC
jgi:hypothetical protein